MPNNDFTYGHQKNWTAKTQQYALGLQEEHDKIKW